MPFTDPPSSGEIPESPAITPAAEPIVSDPAEFANAHAPEAESPSAAPDPADDDSMFGIAQREFGYDLRGKYQTEREALKGLIEGQRLISQRDEFASIGKQVAPYLPQFHQWLQDKTSPKPPAQDPPQPSTNWDAPEYDPNWVNQLREDENGNIIGDPAVIAKLRAFETWRNNKQREMTAKPWPTLKPALEPEFRNIAREEARAALQQEFGSREVAATTQQVIDRNRGLFFSNGDPNQPPTAWGQYYHNVAMQMVRDGVPVSRIPTLAERVVLGDLASQRIVQAQTQAAAAQAVQQDPRLQRRTRANADAAAIQPSLAKQPTAAGSPAVEMRQGEQLDSYLQRMMAQSGHKIE